MSLTNLLVILTNYHFTDWKLQNSIKVILRSRTGIAVKVKSVVEQARKEKVDPKLSQL